MKSVSRTVVATTLAILLAFGMPATALAELAGAVSGLAPQANEVLESAPDADGVRWLYRVDDGNVYVVGCDSELDSVTIPGVVTVAGPEPEVPDVPEPEDPEDPDAVAPVPETQEAAVPEEEPETLPVYGVSSIKVDGVNQWSSFSAIRISPAIEVIANRAFMGCENLGALAVDPGSALREIGSEAFANSGIIGVAFPRNLELVGDYAFYQCARLQDVSMANREGGLTFGDAVFRDCTSLRQVELPTSMPQVNDLMFSGCESLSILALPEGVTGIGEGAFAGSGITGMAFPPSLTRIGNHAFSNCAELESVEFSEGLKVIGCGSFNDNVKLKALDFPASLTTIKGAGEITANGVTTEYEGSFEGCSSLAKVTFPETSDLESLGNASFCYCENLVDFTLPKASNLKELGSGVFTGTAIELFYIPESVASIGSYAFSSTPIRGLTGSAYWKLRFLNGKAFEDCPNYRAPDYSWYGLDEQGGNYYRYDTKVTMTGTKSYSLANEVLDSTASVKGLNEKVRQPAGVEDLAMDGELQEAAMLRATELPVRFDHIRPFDKSLDYRSVSVKAEKEIITVTPTLSGAINNFAQGQNGALLGDGGYKSAGIGCFMQSNKYYWVILLSSEEATEPAAGSTEEPAQVSVGLRSEAGYWPSLDIIAASQSAKAGQVMQLSLTCQAPGGYPARIDLASSAVFMSTDPSVASVDPSTGFVTFKKAGNVAIYANLKGAENSMESAWANFNVAAKNTVNDNITVTGLVTGLAYDGSEKTQDGIVVTTKDGDVLARGVHYELSYENNVNAGTATLYIAGINEYGGKVSTTFDIVRAPQTLEYKRVAKTVKAKRKKTVAVAKASKAKGAVTYYNMSTKKASKKLKVNKATGKVKVPAKMKKGTYKLIVQARADGRVGGLQNYEPGSKKVSLKVRVR